MSKYRKEIPMQKSKHNFTKNAIRQHPKNRISAGVLRGGIRL